MEIQFYGDVALSLIGPAALTNRTWLWTGRQEARDRLLWSASRQAKRAFEPAGKILLVLNDGHAVVVGRHPFNGRAKNDRAGQISSPPCRQRSQSPAKPRMGELSAAVDKARRRAGLSRAETGGGQMRSSCAILAADLADRTASAMQAMQLDHALRPV
jgi:hypothetical protein